MADRVVQLARDPQPLLGGRRLGEQLTLARARARALAKRPADRGDDPRDPGGPADLRPAAAAAPQRQVEPGRGDDGRRARRRPPPRALVRDHVERDEREDRERDIARDRDRRGEQRRQQRDRVAAQRRMRGA